MSTNRTKIDWAYKKALKFCSRSSDYNYSDVRELAAMFRRLKASNPKTRTR